MGIAITGDYAIAAWSYILTWPADQAPYCMSLTESTQVRNLTRTTDRYGWESSVALLTTAIIMTFLLRYFDAKYFRLVYCSQNRYSKILMRLNLENNGKNLHPIWMDKPLSRPNRSLNLQQKTRKVQSFVKKGLRMVLKWTSKSCHKF